MTSKRLYYTLVGILLILAGIGIGSIYLGNQMLEKKTAQLTSLKIETIALDDQQRSLLQAKKDINTYAELEAIVKTIVPQEKDQARTVREIIKLANESGVRIGTISFPSSTLGQPVQKTPVSQIKPVEGIPGLFQLEISIQSEAGSTVGYQQFLNFLKKLEQNRRTAQVTNLSIQPSTKDRNQVTFSLNINVYVKP